jgi:hypothetical protein
MFDDATKDTSRGLLKLNFGHLKWIADYSFVIFATLSDREQFFIALLLDGSSESHRWERVFAASGVAGTAS